MFSFAEKKNEINFLKLKIFQTLTLSLEYILQSTVRLWKQSEAM